MDLYTVRPGDSLPGIARRCGCRAETLLHSNQLSDGARLIPNLALLLPGPEPPGRRELLVSAFARPGIPRDALAETLPCLSFFCPLSYRVTAQGELLAPEDAALIGAARAAGAAPVLTLTNLGETGGFSSEIAHALFSDPAVQTRVLDALPALLEEKAYAGVNLHFQYVYPFDRDGYNRFLGRACELLHARGCYLLTTLAPRESPGQDGLLCAAHDYTVHGEFADRVVLMTCEWGYAWSAPQALSPIGRMRRTLEYARSLIPAEKLLMTLSTGGYRWRLPWRQGDSAQPIGSAAAVDLAVSVGAELKYDSSAEAPYFTYTDAEGLRSVVWFEDARSVRARLKLALEYGVGGISWQSVNRLYRPALLLQQEMISAVRLI